MPAGGTSELYIDQDNPQSVLGAPPSAPVDIPPPTKPAEPVIHKERKMMDQNPDGSIRDTSTEALRKGNDLGFRNISDEEHVKPPAEPTPPPEAAKPPEPAAPPPTPEPPKLYAGKFKSAEELEKGYEEAQKLITKQGQEKAELERQRLAAPPPPPAPKTPEQIAAEQAQANKVLNDFVADPEGYLNKRDQKVQQTTLVALKAQSVAEQWRKDNPDLAQHEIRVAFEATLLAQSDPELAANHEALLQKATDNFRQFTGKLRTEGAKEALTQETRTIPLLSGTSPTPATEHPAKAPLTPEAAYDTHMRFLKEQEKKSHRGLRR